MPPISVINSPPLCRYVVSVGFGVLGGDDGSGQTPVNVRGGAGTILQLISAGDPFDLAGLQVGAGSKGEAHERERCELRELYHGSERVRQIQEAIHERPQTSARDQNAGNVTAADTMGRLMTALPVDVARTRQRKDLQRGDGNGGAADRERQVGDRVGHRSGSELRELYHGSGRGVTSPSPP